MMAYTKTFSAKQVLETGDDGTTTFRGIPVKITKIAGGMPVNKDTYDKCADELIKMRAERVRELLLRKTPYYFGIEKDFLKALKELPGSITYVSADEAAGFIPLPIKAEPARIIPAFPASTYNFLKR
jgi:hypothetical protein